MIVPAQQIHRIPVNFDDVCLPQVPFREAAAKKAHGFDADLARGLRVVGCVADGEDFTGLQAVEFLESRLEDVRVRLGFLGVIAGGARLDQIVDLEQFRVMLEFILLGRTGEGDLQALRPHVLEEFRHPRKRTELVPEFFLEKLAALRLDLVLLFFQFLLCEEHRQQLVTALADLRADLLERGVPTVADQNLPPGFGVLIDRVQEGAVDANNTRRAASRVGPEKDGPPGSRTAKHRLRRVAGFPPGGGPRLAPGAVRIINRR